MAGYGLVDPLHDGTSVEGDRLSDVPDVPIEVYGDGTGAVRRRRAGRDRAGRDRFTWTAAHTLASILVLVLVGAVIAWFIELPYYALTPGSARRGEQSHKGPVCRPALTPWLGAPRLCGAHSHAAAL